MDCEILCTAINRKGRGVSLIQRPSANLMMVLMVPHSTQPQAMSATVMRTVHFSRMARFVRSYTPYSTSPNGSSPGKACQAVAFGPSSGAHK